MKKSEAWLKVAAAVIAGSNWSNMEGNEEEISSALVSMVDAMSEKLEICINPDFDDDD